MSERRVIRLGLTRAEILNAVRASFPGLDERAVVVDMGASLATGLLEIVVSHPDLPPIGPYDEIGVAVPGPMRDHFESKAAAVP